jgi:acetyltransferase-like isoleucine patch superfamily enzyme
MSFNYLFEHYNNDQSPYHFKTFDFVTSNITDKFVTFLEDKSYLNLISENAIIIFVSNSLRKNWCDDSHRLIVWVNNARISFFEFLQQWNQEFKTSNSVDLKLTEGCNCEIHSTCILEGEIVLGNNVKIGPYTRIVGPVSIGDGTEIGSYSEIGKNGFQISKGKESVNCKIPHLGQVRIGSFCYIGSYVNISKSLFSDSTEIGDNVNIDTFVHISHNVKIGNSCILGSQVVLCGGVLLGNFVQIAPSAVLNNKVAIVDNVVVGLGSIVIRKLNKPGVYFGNPAKLIP